MSSLNKSHTQLLSVVVPVFNEQETIPSFYARTKNVLTKNGLNHEIIFVNDGSSDQSLETIRFLMTSDDTISLVSLSRNFGKEIAMTAGFDHAQGDATVVIDADLQDPPELIPEMIDKWKQGYDVVYATRIEREGETAIRKLTAKWFYKLLQRSTNIPIPRDTGDYRLLSRRALNALNSLRERNRFMKGLYSWIGFPQVSIPYHREARYAGASKWNYWKLWNFALEGFTSFTTVPLKVATYLGMVTSFGAFSFGIYVLVKTLLYGDPVAGYPSLMVTLLFLGGVQLTALGIIGEYLGRLFDESKNRPLYIVSEYLTPSSLKDNNSETENV
jgi:glycosyltransferase involved in cell wall biosynthesis